MKVPEIIAVLERLINSLNAERATVNAAGNLTRLAEIDAKIEETETTLTQLRSLLPD
jgi:hypothetical protein